ncbi:MAG TPA: imidazole glycerol phosphate synthase subunit HisH [Candidatus Micrarchaeota archaeon]|nr:imidazole glycerol phosphate synthase subunit HisH [Candidatus Micrarchaeota archaeon]
MENPMDATGIIDLGIGNIASVSNAVLRAGGKPTIISKKGMIGKCERLIIPGVGSFGPAMRAISPYKGEVLEFAKSGKPVLGICLGMQIMLGKGFEAGEYKGLGLFEGSVRRMDFAPKLPHVGWARIGCSMNENNCMAGGNGKMNGNELWKGGILEGLEQGEYVYFVHSYACFPEEKGVVQATCDYGKDFTACINKKNVWGVQFHPEKSGKAGAKIIGNFLKL